MTRGRAAAGSSRRSEGPGQGETLDSICGGLVRVLQRERGYRFNLDPILLAHFAQASARGLRGEIADLGTGTAIIPLVLARKFGLSGITAVELQPSLYELAERNVRLNGCEGEIRVLLADVRQLQGELPRGAFSHVLANPPYGRIASGRVSPAAERALARHELLSSLEDFARAAAYLLADRGSAWFVHPAPRLTELVTVLSAHRLEPRRVQLVHPYVDDKGRLALVQAVKGARNQVTVCAPLVLHQRGERGFTPPVEEMLGPDFEIPRRADRR